MTYKGYEGVVEYDDEAGVFSGHIINTRDVVTFEGTTVKELRKAFRDSIDDYLAFCKELGKEPEKPFSGKLLLRIGPELHRQLVGEAAQKKLSLNGLIQDKLVR
jgi:predicted HicB family RNase H-like nuclease